MKYVEAHQDISAFGDARIEVPGESVAARLADVLEKIKTTEGKWYGGDIDSVEKRMALVHAGLVLARQYRSDLAITASTLSAIDIENHLLAMYDNLCMAREQMSYEEIELPQFDLHVIG